MKAMNHRYWFYIVLLPSNKVTCAEILLSERLYNPSAGAPLEQNLKFTAKLFTSTQARVRQSQVYSAVTIFHLELQETHIPKGVFSLDHHQSGSNP